MSQQHLSYQQRYSSIDSTGPSMKSSYGVQHRPPQLLQSSPVGGRPPSPQVPAEVNRYPQQAGNAATAFPRSASEALFDTSTKFRQLPCRTFISVGTCPYRERCVYLHDPRCICREAKTKTRRKNKEDVVMDALFWPVMPYPMVAAKLDANRQPHVIQPYSVPLPQADQYRRHDTAVYSMWMHFVDFCLANSEGTSAAYADASACFSAPDVEINSYTQLPRLEVFRTLCRSNGRSLAVDEVKNAVQKKRAVPMELGGSLEEIEPSLPAIAVPRRVNGKTNSPVTVTGAFDASPLRPAPAQAAPFGTSFGTSEQAMPPIFESIWGKGGYAVDSISPTGVDSATPMAAGAYDFVDEKMIPDGGDYAEFAHNFSVDAIISY